MNDDFWSIPVDRDSSRNRARLLLSQRAERRALEAEREGLVKVQLPVVGVLSALFAASSVNEVMVLRSMIAKDTPAWLRALAIVQTVAGWFRLGFTSGGMRQLKKTETEEERRRREASVPPYTKTAAAVSVSNLVVVALVAGRTGGVKKAAARTALSAATLAAAVFWVRPQTPAFTKTNNRLQEIAERLKTE